MGLIFSKDRIFQRPAEDAQTEHNLRNKTFSRPGLPQNVKPNGMRSPSSGNVSPTNMRCGQELWCKQQCSEQMSRDVNAA